MNKGKALSTAPFLIFVVAYIIIGLSLWGAYTRLGFQTELFGAGVFTFLWPLFVASLAGANVWLFFTIIVLSLLEVFFQTRYVFISGKSLNTLRVSPFQQAWKNPLLGLALTHGFMLSIWLLVYSSKSGISAWILIPSSLMLTPIAIFLIFQVIRRLVDRKPRFS